MVTHLLTRIDLQKNNFSKGQKRIASYIEEHYDKAAFMTAAKLGETVGVSESTVVRFATEIGYDGYPKLQKAMQEMIRDKLTSVQRIEVTSSRIGEEGVLTSILNQDIDKIRRTIEETDHKDFENAVNSIAKAKRIYIFGVRSTASLAQFLGYYLGLMFDNVRIITTTSHNQTYEQMFRISEDDVFIGISFPRYSSMAVDAMHFARERGADVVAITDSMISPLVANADYVLIARSDMASIVDSLVAPLSLINALIVAAVLKRKDEVVETFQKLEEVWNSQEIYANRPDVMKKELEINSTEVSDSENNSEINNADEK
ncbi:MAG: MurR/RpiR family transcriptional regulator [Ruminococcus sp.]